MSGLLLPHRRQQSGIALVVVLIMVLLVTGLGITAVRTLILQERMASNSFDRNLALQSAENLPNCTAAPYALPAKRAAAHR